MAVQPFINKTSNYAVGTATATNGSVTVTFAGASLVQTDPTTGIVSSVCTAGDRFNVPGVGSGTIQAIDPGGEQITLAEPWGGATQAGVAYTIYRYSTPAQGVVLAAANQAITQGQDSNPALSECIDDGTARLKLRLRNGAASVAVGATGTADASLVEGMDISTTGVASFPNGAVPPADWSNNRIINGGFDVWQNGTAFSLVTGTYGNYLADQWFIDNPNTGQTLTASKVSSPSGFSAPNAMNMQVNSAAAGSYIDLCQRFEGQLLADFNGEASVLSFDLSASTSAGSLIGEIFILANTALDNGSFSSGIIGGGEQFTLPIGAGRVSIPIANNLPALFGLGAQLYIRFTQNGAAGNINVTIGAVKWEKGPVASPWSPKPIAQEWLACQRYYAVVSAQFAGYATSANCKVNGLTLAQPMRANPTIAQSAAAYGACTGINIGAASPQSLQAYLTGCTTSANCWASVTLALNARL